MRRVESSASFRSKIASVQLEKAEVETERQKLALKKDQLELLPIDDFTSYINIVAERRDEAVDKVLRSKAMPKGISTAMRRTIANLICRARDASDKAVLQDHKKKRLQ